MTDPPTFITLAGKIGMYGWGIDVIVLPLKSIRYQYFWMVCHLLSACSIFQGEQNFNAYNEVDWDQKIEDFANYSAVKRTPGSRQSLREQVQTEKNYSPVATSRYYCIVPSVQSLYGERRVVHTGVVVATFSNAAEV